MSLLGFRFDEKARELLVDGDEVGMGHCLNFRDLVRSAFSSGDYYFFVCGCGDAGCADALKPIEVEHDGARIHWHIIEPAPERWYSFDRETYLESLQQGLAELLVLNSAKSRSSTIGPHGATLSTYSELLSEVTHGLDPSESVRGWRKLPVSGQRSSIKGR